MDRQTDRKIDRYTYRRQINCSGDFYVMLKYKSGRKKVQAVRQPDISIDSRAGYRKSGPLYSRNIWAPIIAAVTAISLSRANY